MDTITKVGKLGPAKKSPSSSRKRGNYKGKSVKKQQDNIKVVYISTPMKVKTHASKFREIVQELTGKYSDVARIMEATGGGCGGTDDTYWTIDNEHQQPLMKPELQQPLSTIETGTGADGFFHLMVDNDHYYSQSPSTTVDDRTPSASVSEESTSPPASVLMYDESQQLQQQYYNLGDDLIKTAGSDYDDDDLVVMGVDHDDGDLLTGGGQFNYLEFLSDDYQSSQEDDLDVLGKY